MFCMHCGHGVWHRTGKHRRYVCGNVRHATGACDAAPFDAHLTEETVLRYLQEMFFDFDRWLEGVASHRLSQREGYERVLAGIREERTALYRREAQKRRDYRNAEDALASRAALDALRDLALERVRLDAEEDATAAALERDERQSAADDMLDFWNDLSRAIREEVVNAASVREANAALRERFAAIFVTSPPGGPPRLDFILQDREPGAPVVSASLWAVDPANPEHKGILEGWQWWEPEDGSICALDLGVGPAAQLADLGVGIAVGLQQERQALVWLQAAQQAGRVGDPLAALDEVMGRRPLAGDPLEGLIVVTGRRAEQPLARAPHRKRLPPRDYLHPRREVTRVAGPGPGEQDLDRALVGVLGVVAA